MNERRFPDRGRHARVTEDPAGPSTRERILDVALDLFIEKGFDRSSLREIAEQLGFSKAAIYYYFVSKDDILMALHLRLHEVLRRAVEQLGQPPAGMDSWAALLDELIGEMLAHRKIFVMHDRNRSAFEHLHQREHEAEHEDLEDEVRRVIGDPSLPRRDRIGIACAVGAVTTLVMYGDLLRDVPSDELEGLMQDAVGKLLGSRVRRRRPAARRQPANVAKAARSTPSARKYPRAPRRAAP